MRDKRSVRLVVAEPLQLLCDGVCSLLESQPGLQVLGSAQTGDEVVQMAETLRPDILLVAIDLPKISCFDVLRELPGRSPQTRALVLVDDAQTPRCIQALENGARGILSRSSSKELLYKSIRCVMAGEYWVGREQMATLCCYLREARQKGDDAKLLTWRETEVVSAILSGSTNKDIANQLSISQETVKHHVTNVFRKFKVSNRLELALYAAQIGLLPQLTETPVSRDSNS
jgi:two-component system, NarL family, nitrate/nitrite response regulator NarL